MKDKTQKKINNLSKKYKDKKILLYGAGKYADMILKNYNFSKLNIIAIADKKFENNKEDKLYYGYSCTAPNELIGLNYDVIIFLTIYSENIKDYLRQNHLINENIELIDFRHIQSFEPLYFAKTSICTIVYKEEFPNISDSIKDFFAYRKIESNELLDFKTISYIEHKNKDKNEIAWFYTKRLGIIQRITFFYDKKHKLRVKREILGNIKNPSTEFVEFNLKYFSQSFDFIYGKNLHAYLANIKDEKELKTILEKIIGEIFEKFKDSNDLNYLSSECCDNVPKNILIDEKGIFRFFDFETKYKFKCPKSTMLLHVFQNNNLILSEKELYEYFCEKFNLLKLYERDKYFIYKYFQNIADEPYSTNVEYFKKREESIFIKVIKFIINLITLKGKFKYLECFLLNNILYSNKKYLDLYFSYSNINIPWWKKEYLKEKIYSIFNKKTRAWGRGNLYQSFDSLGIIGQRPSKDRIDSYKLKNILKKSDDILDIGCNIGFLDFELSPYVNQIDAIDNESDYIKIANITKKTIKNKNCTFKTADFNKFQTNKKYDMVICISVWYWIGMEAETFSEKIYGILNKNGTVLIESQNIDTIDKNFDDYVEKFCFKRFKKLYFGKIKDDNIVNRKYCILQKV